ncbi:MAG: chemotaxis protein CheB [Clostridiales bacterium]
MPKLKVLIAQDITDELKIYRTAINNTGLAKLILVESEYENVLDNITNIKPDIVVIDKIFSNRKGVELLKSVKKVYSNLNIIMLFEKGDNEFIFDILKFNNVDMIFKQNPENKERAERVLKVHFSFIFNQIYTNKCKNEVKEEIKTVNDSFNDLVIRKAREIEKVYYNKVDLNKFQRVDFILIASSTGGPGALEKLLKKLDDDIKTPILIVQHMPKGFTKGLSENLNRKVNIRVVEAENDLDIENGIVYIAQGGYHMAVKNKSFNRSVISIFKDSSVNNVIPAADVLFKSIAENYNSAYVLAIVLTGMGSDGKNGVYDLKKKCNCYCLTQNEKSCVVYGMPKSIYENGLSDEELDINKIGNRINEIVKYRR